MQLIKQKKEKRERERLGWGARGRLSSSHCEVGIMGFVCTIIKTGSFTLVLLLVMGEKWSENLTNNFCASSLLQQAVVQEGRIGISPALLVQP